MLDVHAVGKPVHTQPTRPSSSGSEFEAGAPARMTAAFAKDTHAAHVLQVIEAIRANSSKWGSKR
jgi:hypothetical protein